MTGDVLTVGVLLAVTGAFGLAVQSLCIRYGTVESDSTDALVVVLAVNVAVLVPAALVLGDPLRTLTPRSIAAFAAAGLVGTMIGRAMHYEGIKRIGASRAEPIKASQPLHASLIAVLVLNETVGLGHLASMVCIVLGIALVSYEYGRSNGDASNGNYAALAFPVAAAFVYGIEPTFAKIGFQAGSSVATGLALKVIFAGAGFVLYLVWTTGVPSPASFRRADLPWLVGAGLSNTLFLFGYYGALTVEPVSVVVPLVQSSPLIIIAISALFVSDKLERITWRIATGAAIVVVGAIGVTLLG